MCTVCGCAADDATISGETPMSGDYVHAPSGPDHHHSPHPHPHAAHHPRSHQDAHALEHPGGAAPVLSSEPRLVSIERDILAKNDALAMHNRRHLATHQILALNLVSSPGAGKTTVLVRTLSALMERLPVAVIEGDQETSADADRIRATGAPAVQVNTGRGCHLDAEMVAQAFDRLPLPTGGVLFIENVGNLVCPAGFDLGEAHKVVVASVTEGEDKPLKYPHMFAAADLMLVNKCDLLPHLAFDVEALIANARRIRPDIGVLRVSASTGEGFDCWLAWIDTARALRQAAAAE